jgi:hypothetical protein
MRNLLTSPGSAWGAAAALAAVVGWSSLCVAEPEKRSCSATHEQAQRARLEGKFLETLELAQLCTQPHCSSVLIGDCVRIYEDAKRDVPTFVFAVRDPDGAELLDVSVFVDGQLIAERIDGSAYPLDPGLHRFSFRKSGIAPVEVAHTARVGEKNRLVEVTLGTPRPKPAPPAAGDQVVLDSERAGSKSPPLSAWVLAGVSAAALGGFTYFRLSADADYRRLKDDCSPGCRPGAVDDVRTSYTYSHLSLGLSAAALTGAGVIYYFTRARGRSDGARGALTLVPDARGGHASFALRF